MNELLWIHRHLCALPIARVLLTFLFLFFLCIREMFLYSFTIAQYDVIFHAIDFLCDFHLKTSYIKRNRLKITEHEKKTLFQSLLSCFCIKVDLQRATVLIFVYFMWPSLWLLFFCLLFISTFPSLSVSLHRIWIEKTFRGTHQFSKCHANAILCTECDGILFIAWCGF